MKKNAIYLRKSRLDVEAEKAGEGETLKRHETKLMSLANKLRIIIDEDCIYREVVSGETIAARPEMQRLLRDVEQGKFESVLVMEVERLARGDTMDQGLVAQVFKYSNTKIVTPQKTFEANKESDEEYLEFGLFMSRREYQTTRRRLQTGRMMSVYEGKYVGNIAPFGYDREKLNKQKGFTLIENKEESQIVKLIFKLFTDNNLSQNRIAIELNNMGYKPRIAKEWTVSAIKDILSNPVYIGKIRWNARKEVKTMKNGIVEARRPRNTGEDLIVVNGLHAPIIDMETWQKAKERKNTYSHRAPMNKGLKNPLAGIIICGVCGKKMYRRPYQDPEKDASLICANPKCDNVSSKFCIVEEQVLIAIKDWLNDYSANLENMKSTRKEKISALQETVNRLKADLSKAERKLDNICDLFEDGVYTKETYFDRSKKIAVTIETISNNLREKEAELSKMLNTMEDDKTVLSQLHSVLDIYNEDISIEQKNVIFKNVLQKIEYVKTEKALKKNSDPYNFTLNIYPKLWKTKAE